MRWNTRKDLLKMDVRPCSAPLGFGHVPAEETFARSVRAGTKPDISLILAAAPTEPTARMVKMHIRWRCPTVTLVPAVFIVYARRFGSLNAVDLLKMRS
jgi:hypothetical protein